jgi:hypothetical protein
MYPVARIRGAALLACAGAWLAANPVIAGNPPAPPPPGTLRVLIPAKLTSSSSTPHGEVASALDAAGALHVVFTQAIGGGEDLYYSRVTGSTFTPPIPITALHFGRVRYPYVAVDGAGTVHVAFWVRRVNDAPLRTGNNAVYWAHGGAGGFAVEQVSENPVNPADNALGPFNAYVNDRPRLLFDSAGQPVVVYLSSHFKGRQDYGTYVIVATRGAGGFQREQAFRTQPDHSVDDGVAAPSRWGALRQLVYYDIDKYHPHLVTFGDGRWNDVIVDGPSGFTNLDDVALEYDSKGAAHLTWVAKKDKLFLHRRVEGGAALEPLDRVPTAKMPWSNFSPTAIDPLTDRVYFLYEDVMADEKRHTLLAPSAGGGYREIPVPTLGELPGAIYGHESLHVRGGRVYFVTASEKAGGIFVTSFVAP